MNRPRFDILWRHVWWSHQPYVWDEGTVHEPHWWKFVEYFVTNFNYYHTQLFSPSDIICADESISRWYGKGGHILSNCICWCMWQYTGSQKMGQRDIMMHAGGRGLWCRSGLLNMQGMSKSRKMMKTISLVVQKWWSNLWCHGLTWEGSFAHTHTLHQCLLLKNCGSMDSISLASSRRKRINFQVRNSLT